MRRIIFTLLLFAATSVTFAQQKYYAFSINGKHGITDTLGNEVIKPIYGYTTLIAAKNQIYLQDFSDKPDIIFNAKTGVKQLHERVLNNQVQIKNTSYSIITNKEKKYLLSEENDKIIPITIDYNDFRAFGQYIIADYDFQEPFVSGGRDKNGIPLPPKIRKIKKQYVVLSNDESLKTIVDKGFDTYLPLYKTPEEKKDDGIVKTVEVILSLPIQENSAIFDYIILSQGNNHKLYDAKMALVKAFVLAKADQKQLVDYTKKLLKVNISTQASNEHGIVSAPPMMAAPNGTRKNNPAQESEEKKPFKPFFYTKKLENGNTIFALQETEEISKRIFEAKATSKVNLYVNRNEITIKVAGKEDSKFSYNPKTGEIYLPKAYLETLGLNVL